jgi:formylglycine-generating enzyme required for sulfatase activity
MRAIRRIILMLTALLLTAAGAAAEQRIALVVGNSAYPDIPLVNPVNDAALIATTLREQGFEVIEALDVGRSDMARAVKDFGNRLKAAEGEALGLFYYAGHGLQVRGENFLIPVDAEIEDEGDVDIYAISASAILRTIEDARNGLNIVILDACRNNPFARSFRAVSRGLALMEAPTGTLLAYSTAPGQVALDGAGANSPYTESLAKAMAAPGISIERVFKNARNDVLMATQGKQTPWEASSLTGDDYYLVAAAGPVAEPTDDVSQSAPELSTDRSALDLAFWDAIKDSDDPRRFQAYLDQYPEGGFAAIARLRLEELSETEVAVITPPPEIEVEPLDSLLVALRNANARGGPSTDFYQIGRLSAGEEVTVTGKVTGRDWYRVALADGSEAYVWAPLLGEPPEPTPVPATDLSLAMWVLIEDSDRAADFESFLAQYPTSPMARSARDRLAELRQVAVVKPLPEPEPAPPSHRAGETFQDCPTCPEMVVVPPGSFQMGSPSGEDGHFSDEGPLHRVSVRQAFAIGKHEVTFSQWDACVSAGGCSHRPKDNGWGRGSRPVIYVSWNDAQEYVRWLSGKTGQTYRLLTEAEWEYAARAGTHTARYWGNAIGHNKANCDGCSSRWDNKQTAPVGSFSPNGFGLHDMLGNVFERTQDCYHDSYSGAPSHSIAWQGSSGCPRVSRGGSWVVDPRGARAAYRGRNDSGFRSNHAGFRVARTLF